MSLLRGRTFAFKMTLMALLASGVAVGTVILSFLVFDSISSHSRLQSRLSTLADVVGQNSTAALHFDDRTAAVEVLTALQAEPPVIYGCLYDVSNRLFAQYQREREVQNCPADLPRMARAGRNYSSVIRPVFRHGELVGTVFLSSDLQDLEKRRSLLLQVSSVLLLIALLVSWAATSALQRAISKPISELARVMHRVTIDQDFDTRVVVHGSDEIAGLGTGLNTMLSELQRREDAKKNAEAKLQFQALTDALTGLPNRRLFTDRLAQTLALARREGRMVALLYIDLDGFKLVNDSLGHSLGDALLVQVAERLQSRVRQADTLARLGGDEFTVVLGNVHTREASTVVAKSLLDILGTPFLIEGHQLTISASIGISLFPEHGKNASELLQQADSAMYAGKRDGKNQVKYYTPELGVLVRERLSLENELRRAMARAEVILYYQPEFDIRSNRLLRFEALARWPHPTLGPISPATFIPIAEESGLIVPLGLYLLEMAGAQAVKWQAAAPYPIQVAVNVSTIQFRRDQFVEEVSEVLKRTGLKPELLQLELTESIMLSGVRHASEKMKRLKELGVSLAIDDFGTGYSCLSYLPSLPFDALKIDRSFIQQLGLRAEGEAMVHTLITLGHKFHMRVIVEGVEKVEQLQLIRKLGGDEIQGFLLGQPTPDPGSQISLLQNQPKEPLASPAVVSR